MTVLMIILRLGIDRILGPSSGPVGVTTTPRRRTILALFVVMSVAFSVLALPRSLNLSRFAFEDDGANLAEFVLIEHGSRPGVDDGYIYGLAGLPLGASGWDSSVGPRRLRMPCSAWGPP